MTGAGSDLHSTQVHFPCRAGAAAALTRTQQQWKVLLHALQDRVESRSLAGMGVSASSQHGQARRERWRPEGGGTALADGETALLLLAAGQALACARNGAMQGKVLRRGLAWGSGGLVIGALTAGGNVVVFSEAHGRWMCCCTRGDLGDAACRIAVGWGTLSCAGLGRGTAHAVSCAHMHQYSHIDMSVERGVELDRAPATPFLGPAGGARLTEAEA
jgi:hypothetical protein